MRKVAALARARPTVAYFSPFLKKDRLSVGATGSPLEQGCSIICADRLSVGAGLFANLFRLVIKTHERGARIGVRRRERMKRGSA